MVMRWKILELAEQDLSLDDLLVELKKHPEYDLPDDGGLGLLYKYCEILPERLQAELRDRSSSVAK